MRIFLCCQTTNNEVDVNETKDAVEGGDEEASVQVDEAAGGGQQRESDSDSDEVVNSIHSLFPAAIHCLIWTVNSLLEILIIYIR
jgi:hypothetical protein